MKKMHLSLGPDQQRITTFFPILNKLQILVTQNETLSNAVNYFMEKSCAPTCATEGRVQATSSAVRTDVRTEASQTNFLAKLLETSYKTCDTNKKWLL